MFDGGLAVGLSGLLILLWGFENWRTLRVIVGTLRSIDIKKFKKHASSKEDKLLK